MISLIVPSTISNSIDTPRTTFDSFTLLLITSPRTEMQATHAEHLRKRKLNQLAPISRLFPEIFSIIFCLVRDETIRPNNSMYIWHPTKYCIALTHVCHEWRDIAIDNPSLWKKIYVSVDDHLEWVQEMLRRSKQCSLHVLVSKSHRSAISESFDPILRGLKNDLHRIFDLNLLGVPIEDLNNFFSKSHSDRLTILHIKPYRISPDTSSDDDMASDERSVAKSRFTLSDDALRVDTLRYFRIEHLGLDFHAAFIRCLVHLELLEVNRNCRLPCAEFIAVLVTMPALQYLILDGYLEEDEVEDMELYVNTTKKIHLRLNYLDITCRRLGEMIQFLCILVVPPSCKLRLFMAHGGPETAPGFHLIISWLSSHFQHVPSFHSFRSNIRTWHFKRTNSVSTDLQISGFYDSEAEEEEIRSHTLTASIVLCHDFESEDELIDDLWRSFFKTLPLSNLVSLEVKDDDITLPESIWEEIFAPITTLKTIVIDSNYYATFFLFASPISIAIPFSALSTVTVKAYAIDDYISIVNSLDSRLAAGIGPFDLILYTNNIEPQAVAQLYISALTVQIYPPVPESSSSGLPDI